MTLADVTCKETVGFVSVANTDCVSCFSRGGESGWQKNKWSSTETPNIKTRSSRDLENASPGLVLLVKDCLNQWTKVISKTSIFCWTRTRKSRGDEKHIKQKVNEFQILLKISSHEVAEFPLSLIWDQEYSTESTKKGRNPPGKGPGRLVF